MRSPYDSKGVVYTKSAIISVYIFGLCRLHPAHRPHLKMHEALFEPQLPAACNPPTKMPQSRDEEEFDPGLRNTYISAHLPFNTKPVDVTQCVPSPTLQRGQASNPPL